MSTPYTRSAILAWVNEVLETSFGTFQEIPAHEVGLLLHGIFQTSAASAAPSTAPSTDGASSVPLLDATELAVHHQQHQRTCLRYLQLLQFPQSSAAAEGGSGHDGATVVAVSAAQQQRNAEHVLAMIHALSREEADLLHAEAARAPVPEGAGANVVLTLGPAMTPAAWLGGRAFVEELKLWRWLRLMAARHHRSVGAIRRAVRAYVQRGDNSTGSMRIRASGHAHAATGSRDVSPAPRMPAVPAEPRADAPRIGVRHPRAEAGGDADEDDGLGEALRQELKRMKPEMPPSSSPVPMQASAAAAPFALTSPTPLIGSVSPVHARISPARAAAAPPLDAADADGRTAGKREDTATAPQWRAAAVGDEAPVRESRADTPTLTATTTTTPFVARVPQLQAALLHAQATLQSELTQHHHQQRTSAASATASPRTSDEAASNDATALAAPALPHVAAPGDALEVSCRQHMLRQLHSAPDVAGSSATDAPASPLPAGLTCAVCPSLVAHAIQCNLAALDEMEETRARAIAACLRKDPVALLAALQHIV